MYIPKHFDITELVPQSIYSSYPHHKIANLWFLFDERILVTGDRIRERYGPMICNTWNNPSMIDRYGFRQYSGWRPGDCATGSFLSQHKRGGALDLVPRDVHPDEIRADILKDQFCEDFKFITCIETDISWLHIDCRNWDKTKNGIFKVKP